MPATRSFVCVSRAGELLFAPLDARTRPVVLARVPGALNGVTQRHLVFGHSLRITVEGELVHVRAHLDALGPLCAGDSERSAVPGACSDTRALDLEATIPIAR